MSTPDEIDSWIEGVRLKSSPKEGAVFDRLDEKMAKAVRQGIKREIENVSEYELAVARQRMSKVTARRNFLTANRSFGSGLAAGLVIAVLGVSVGRIGGERTIDLDNKTKSASKEQVPIDNGGTSEFADFPWLADLVTRRLTVRDADNVKLTALRGLLNSEKVAYVTVPHLGSQNGDLTIVVLRNSDSAEIRQWLAENTGSRETARIDGLAIRFAGT